MRDEFTKSTKSAAWERCGGKCEECGKQIRSGHGPEFDHIVAAWLGGSADLENCSVLCSMCHSLKTTKLDVPGIAKTKRIHAKHIGAHRPQSRPMLGSKRSGWKHLMNGKWERRT